LDKYASWASASYGATTNSMFSDFKVCDTITVGFTLEYILLKDY
jgi:hypothetical protein